MREERPATRQVFFSLEFSEDGSRVPRQCTPWSAASHDDGCFGTTPMDEFEPNGYELYTVSEWTHSSFHLRNAAQTKATDFSPASSGAQPNNPDWRGPNCGGPKTHERPRSRFASYSEHCSLSEVSRDSKTVSTRS